MDFAKAFHSLTGHPPFPWQERLFSEHFGKGQIPPACCLPTGLGKTSIVAVWLIALAKGANVPRRLIYVVNRRTVVDQTTEEIIRYQKAINSDPRLSAFKKKIEQLRISTLRGQFADNGDWCEDPSKAAVICGTVDIIGSRLLFCGYGIGRNKRPLHAGFLGQDALLIHDEAHLEPAFQTLIETIQSQQHDHEPTVLWPKLKVMELTATSKSENPFTLQADDYANEVVDQRMNSVKQLHLHKLTDAKKPAKELAARALSFKESGKAILVFAHSVEAVLETQAALLKAKIPQRNVKTLTGTMRGKERDALSGDPARNLPPDSAFARFLPQPTKDATSETVYLICTSAGEVGVNISADHLVCDLTTFESMAQRFGRVNRFGKVENCEVHVFHPGPDDWEDKPLTIPRQRTLELLRDLEQKGSVSPKALSELDAVQRSAAFAPVPPILPATDMLFDAWALTTIKDKLPGRPPVEPYLHGVDEYEPPTTQVAWRTEVDWLQPKYENESDWKEKWPSDRKALMVLATNLLDEYPLKPSELLSDRTSRVRDQVNIIADKHRNAPVWVVDCDGEVAIHQMIELTKKEQKDGRTVYQVNTDNCLILLPPSVGGLNERGLLDGASVPLENLSLDVADELLTTDDPPQLARFRSKIRDDENAAGMRLIREVPLSTIVEEDNDHSYWYWFVRKNTGEIKSKKPVRLDGEFSHVADVRSRMDEILRGLVLDECLNECLRLAAQYHDHGKRRANFQTMLGNRRFPKVWWAKSGRKTATRIDEKYRHEFGSLHELPSSSTLGITEDQRELVLHLIAAHHGRARPHFPAVEVYDPDPNCSQQASDELAMTVPQRFGRLQRRYGRWVSHIWSRFYEPPTGRPVPIQVQKVKSTIPIEVKNEFDSRAIRTEWYTAVRRTEQSLYRN